MASKLKAKDPEVKPQGKSKSLVFGKTGTGKTWFALSFPKPFYYDAEGGARLGHYQQRIKDSGGGYMGPRDGTQDFSTLIDQIDALSTEKHEFKTLIVDSVTKLWQIALQNESERLGSKDVFGASKKAPTSWMRKLISRVDRLDMNVLFIAHEATEWGKDDSGQRTEIAKIPDVYEKLSHELDLTLRIEKLSPVLRTATVFKTRLTGFPDGERFDLMQGKNDIGYAEFSKRYGKDFIEGEVVPIVLATEEQVAEINRLLGVIKVDDKELDKMKTKLDIDEWNEMRTDDATKMVAWLKGKMA